MGNIYVKTVIVLLLMTFFLNHSLLGQSLLSIQPDSSQLGISDSITIDVTISNVENLFAVALDLTYDPEIIEFLSAEEGVFLSEGGQVSTSFLYQNNTPGLIIVAISRLDSQIPGVSSEEDTALASFTFTGLEQGESLIEFDNEGLMDPGLSLISVDTTPGVVIVSSSKVNSLDGLPDSQLNLQIYPNPFNSQVTIRLDFPLNSIAEFTIYNITGQKVFYIPNLTDSDKIINWPKGESKQYLSAGCYIIALQTESNMIIKKTLFLK